MLFDTSAWIEFFQGTDKAEKVKEKLTTEENFTSIVTFAELINWCLKNNLESKIKEYIQGIKIGSTILDLDETIVVAAGKINYERKKAVKNWGMLDSFILSTALVYDLKVLTKDTQFEDVPNVEII